MLGGARPLPVPSRGHDKGEVVCLSNAVQLRQEEETMADLRLSVWPG
jgi:hypothetical protein